MLNCGAIVAFPLKRLSAILAFTARSSEDRGAQLFRDFPRFLVIASIYDDLREPDIDGFRYVRPIECALKVLPTRIADKLCSLCTGERAIYCSALPQKGFATARTFHDVSQLNVAI